MKTFVKNLLKGLQQQYINLHYRLKNTLRWKAIKTVYLNVSSNIISKEIFGAIIRGDYEVDENRMLHETLAENDVLLELGTGLGFNAIYAAKINKNRVITFEGNPNMIALIKKNMIKNKVDFELKNEIVISKNFSDTHTAFTIGEQFWQSSTKNNISTTIMGQVSVPTCNINDVLHSYQPTYLAVDIEGGEEDFFDTCDFLIQSSIKKIMIELHADVIGEEKCFAVLKKLTDIGYKLRMDGAPKNVAFLYR